MKTNALRKSISSRNRDPGVNSDDEDFEGHLGEEDDMFRFQSTDETLMKIENFSGPF